MRNPFKPHACSCGVSFKMVEQLMHHEETVHGTRMYDCKKCSMEFRSMEEMREHVQRRHKS